MCADTIDRRGRYDRVVVGDQRTKRRVDTARPTLEQRVTPLDPVLDRQVFEHGDQPGAQLAGEDVVEVLHGAGARTRIAVHDGPPGRRNVLPRVQQAEQSVNPVDGEVELLAELPGEDRVGRQPPLDEQVVVAPETGVVDAPLCKGEPFDRLPGDRQFGMVTMQLLDGGNRLESQKPVVCLQRSDQDVHRRLARDPRQRGGDVAPHPAVLHRVLQAVLEHVDHRLAVPHQRVSRAVLPLSSAEQRHQAWRETGVRLVERADAPHRLLRNLRVRVVEQQDQQIAGSGSRRPAGGGGQVTPDTGRFGARVTGEHGERAFDDALIGFVVALRENHGGGGDDVRVVVMDQEPGIRERVFVAQADEGADRRCPRLRLRIGNEPLDLRRPQTGDVGPDGVDRAKHPRPDAARSVAQQEWSDQVPFVEGLQQVNRVEHPPLVRMRQQLDEGLDRGRVGRLDPHLRRPDAPPGDRRPKRGKVLPVRHDRTDDPEAGDRQTDPTQLGPRQP